MARGFEIEYFNGFSTGPRYKVDVDEGRIFRHSPFIHGRGPIAELDRGYPGTPQMVEDQELVSEVYDKVLDSGLGEGQFFQRDPNGERGLRVGVYGEGSEEVEEIDHEMIDEIESDLDAVF